MARAKAVVEETVQDKVVRLRGEDKGWAEISEELEIGQGKAAYLFLLATVEPEDVITYKDDNDLAKKTVQARNSGLSWGIISARTDPVVPESRLRKLFEAGGGGDAMGHRIGKGGRHPGNGNGVAPAPIAKRVPGKKAAPAAAAAAAPSAPRGRPPKLALGDMSQVQLRERLNGQTLTVDPQDGNKQIFVQVRAVRNSKDGAITFVNEETGKTQTLLLTQIKAASRPKAAAV